MKDQSLRVLMVEDSEDDALLIIRDLKKGGYIPVYDRVETAAAMKKALKEKQWDIILCDYKMPKFNAPSAIAILKEANIDIPIIIVSGTIGEDVAIECMRLGAQDYIMKSNLSRLCPAIARELEDAEVRNKQRQADEDLKESENKYRLSFENVNDVIYTIDTGLTLLSLSPSVETILGYKPQDFIGRSVSDLGNILTPESFEQAIADISVILNGEKISAAIYQFIAKDGTIKYGEVSGSPLMRKGKIIGIISVARDVTERKQMEDMISQSEERYRTILDEMDNSYFEVDLAGNYTFINNAICRQLGYSKEEMLGLNFRVPMVKESIEIVYNAFNNIYITGKPLRGIYYKATRKDGTTGSAEISGFPLKNKKGETIGFRGMALDITERKQAEDALRESEKKYRTILEDMEDVYFEVDIKGNITLVNNSSCKMSGYSEDEMLGLSFKKISAPDGIEKVMQYFGEIFLTGKTGKPFLWNLEKKNGEQGFFELVASLIRDKQGKPIGFRGIGRDVTERKRAEEILQQTLASLRKAFGTTIQVMVSAVEMRDPYTAGHQLRVADIARSIAQEMGLPNDKIDGIRLAGSIHDIGKLSIPAEILSKPTKLTDLEFSLIKEHSRVGYQMLKDVESQWPLAQIVYQHHERMNGSGYPRNLKGDEILIEARIMAVADVVEAMASHRPYRPGLGIQAALEEIEKNKGIVYDNAVADACLRLFREKNYKIP